MKRNNPLTSNDDRDVGKTIWNLISDDIRAGHLKFKIDISKKDYDRFSLIMPEIRKCIHKQLVKTDIVFKKAMTQCHHVRKIQDNECPLETITDEYSLTIEFFARV